MSGLCEGRVVVITGAGRGIGRGHALEFARQGAKVVVNDLGGDWDGTGASSGPANDVAEEIRAEGGEAVANPDDVSSWNGAQRMINQAIDTFGRLDVLVNNAGILRDRMLVNMTEEEWDGVIKVHLKGTFAPAHFAAAYWRHQHKAGEPVDARLINTTSVSGIFGNAGQTNYGAAKAGIAGFTIIASRELERYGVTVNCVSPGALTRMTEGLGGNRPPEPAAGEWSARDPENIAPIVVWLASPEAKDVTGRVFLVNGGRLAVAEGWRRGPGEEKEGRWDPTELGPVVRRLLDQAAPVPGMQG